MIRIFMIAYSFVAAVIGAGFASGQEILSFFTVYGKWGAVGIGLSAALFGGFAYFILDVCRKEQIADYNALMRKIMSRRMQAVSNGLTFLFLICSYSVMTACFGEMMFLLFGMNKAILSVVFTAVCTIILCTGADRALKLNGVLGIIIAAGITGTALYILRYREHQTFAPQVSALISGAGYSGYNLIGSGVILAKMSSGIKSKGEAALTGAISAGALMIMMGLIYLLLSIYYKYINLGEIPMLTLAMRENNIITYFYSVMLVLAVMTTAISSGTGAIELLSVSGGTRLVAAAAVGSAGLLISCAGFSTVINTAYRLCGYAGMMIILYIIFAYKKYSKNLKKVEK